MDTLIIEANGPGDEEALEQLARAANKVLTEQPRGCAMFWCEPDQPKLNEHPPKTSDAPKKLGCHADVTCEYVRESPEPSRAIAQEKFNEVPWLAGRRHLRRYGGLCTLLADVEVGTGGSNYAGLFAELKKTHWDGVMANETDNPVFAQAPGKFVDAAVKFVTESAK